MRKWLSWIGGFVGFSALFVVYLFAARWVLQEPESGCPSGIVVALAGPFSRSDGVAWVQKEFSEPGDGPGTTGSRLVLCEGDSQLGPARSLHRDIANFGEGRYSHWGNNIIFSTSDNSDPNRNGRAYRTVQPW
jgi:hypothetical protein